MTRHADLRLAPELVARLAHRAVTLAKVHAIGLQPLCEGNGIVDDERHVARGADGLQRLGQPRGLVPVNAFDPELERRHGSRRKRPLEPPREIPADVERRDQVELARGALRGVYVYMIAHDSSLPAPVRIGCSGWMYKHWRGLFYPERLAVKRWFAFYAEAFDTVEINNSFYHLPPPKTFEGWLRQAPPGFCYAVKANRFLTQAKKLKDCEEPIARQMASFYALRPKLGPILYQLPTRFALNLERLESFLKLLPHDVTNVFEFREPSWYADAVFALLDRYGASLCAHDMPGSKSPRLAVGPVAYLRFHGGLGKYYGRYTDKALLEWTDWIAGESRAGRAVWAYFNNDPEAHAIHDAQTLRAMVRQAGVGRMTAARELETSA